MRLYSRDPVLNILSCRLDVDCWSRLLHMYLKSADDLSRDLLLLLCVLLLTCSQEEQFFINGRLPEFHQVDIPDIWIGLSGTLQATPYINSDSLKYYFRSLSCLRYYQIRTKMATLDGWIKPRLSFPTMDLAGPQTLQISGIVAKSSQVQSTPPN